MAIGRIDIEKIKANKEQAKEGLKTDKDEEVARLQSAAIEKLYKNKEQIDNSRNTQR
jgi:F0F1-type ATP synthase epsilon subunit